MLIFKERHKSLENGQKLIADFSRDYSCSVSFQRESTKFSVDGWNSIDISDNVSRGGKERFQLSIEFGKTINSNLAQLVQVRIARKTNGSRRDSLIKSRDSLISCWEGVSRPGVSWPGGSVVGVLAKTNLNQAEKSNGLKIWENYLQFG